MNSVDRLARLIGGEIGKLLLESGSGICELRIRAGKRTHIHFTGGREISGGIVTAHELRSILLRLTEDSLYACEEELRQGYFTMRGGYRVGVCGRMSSAEDGRLSLSSIGSICIRIADEALGCATALMTECPRSMLIISPPALGKTTILRDYARLASERGWNVAIADERREIAACEEGVPSFDVGERTDVMDGCSKAKAIPMLVRSCNPQVIIADEIGGEGDARAILDAQRCGVAVVASAHASGFADIRLRFRELINANAFQRLVLLGPCRGQIQSICDLNQEGVLHAEGNHVVCDSAVLRRCGSDAVSRPGKTGEAFDRHPGSTACIEAQDTQFAGSVERIAVSV